MQKVCNTEDSGRADAAEGLHGTCEHHGPQAGSSSRLVATAIGRCSSEGQPLVALDCQPSLPRGAEELFCDSLRTQDLTGSSEAPPMCWTELIDGVLSHMYIQSDKI